MPLNAWRPSASTARGASASVERSRPNAAGRGSTAPSCSSAPTIRRCGSWRRTRAPRKRSGKRASSPPLTPAPPHPPPPPPESDHPPARSLAERSHQAANLDRAEAHSGRQPVGAVLAPDVGPQIPEVVDVFDLAKQSPQHRNRTRRRKPYGVLERGAEVLQGNPVGQVGRYRGKDIAAVEDVAHLGQPALRPIELEGRRRLAEAFSPLHQPRGGPAVRADEEMRPQSRRHRPTHRTYARIA